MIAKLWKFVKLNQHALFLGGCMILIAFTGFNIGRMAPVKKTPLAILDTQKATLYQAGTPQPLPEQASRPTPAIPRDTRIVASKNSDKYHFAYCTSAKRIKEENKIWFQTEAEAQAKGLTLAGNCIK